jgi:hypothetical protein
MGLHFRSVLLGQLDIHKDISATPISHHVSKLVPLKVSATIGRVSEHGKITCHYSSADAVDKELLILSHH